MFRAVQRTDSRDKAGKRRQIQDKLSNADDQSFVIFEEDSEIISFKADKAIFTIDVENSFAIGLMKRDIVSLDSQSRHHVDVPTLTGEGPRVGSVAQKAAKQSVKDLLDAKKFKLNIPTYVEVEVQGVHKSSGTFSQDVLFSFQWNGKAYKVTAKGNGLGDISKFLSPEVNNGVIHERHSKGIILVVIASISLFRGSIVLITITQIAVK
ncbi:hypothetical protein J3R30DRAFT_3890537 [Lentinula aciculospora]|uniref:Uncharacterized protein n=1 Tax=Lentinula aciculospora TaxID=153920 RepID=A0A9W9ABS3_9AGAR|nr:hypothetical protein J3R30DRAFT_3890537 [Lentinula aciculospora]